MTIGHIDNQNKNSRLYFLLNRIMDFDQSLQKEST